MTGPIRVDTAEMTLRDLADVSALLDPVSLVDAIQGPKMADAIAALTWAVQRHHDPTFTLEDAYGLRLGPDIELINAGAVAGPVGSPEVPGASDGATPRTSLEPGVSIRSA